MSITEIILIGIGLAMDATAVSMSNGMCYRMSWKQTLAVGLAFGIFQGGMPLIGYFAGSLFAAQISAFDHWIALILLGFIGGKMVWDGFHDGDESCPVRPFSLTMLLTQAVATSIDALAVGVSFAASSLAVGILSCVSIIAAITFVLSCVAVQVGKKIGDRLGSKAEIFGGTILVLIGLKIFVEHMWLS
jgi:putative Mn2+ efflux pump MntP